MTRFVSATFHLRLFQYIAFILNKSEPLYAKANPDLHGLCICSLAIWALSEGQPSLEFHINNSYSMYVWHFSVLSEPENPRK